MRCIAIGGVPATGKSTLIKKLISNLDATCGQHQKVEEKKLLNSLKWTSGNRNIYIFGKYEDGENFPGTDRLSMAVQPQAEEFLQEKQETNDVLIFEGDRLFNQSFLTKMIESSDDCHFLMLNASPATISQRHSDRKDSQDDKFLRGRKTKYDNIRMNFELGVYILEEKHETEEDTQILLNKIAQIIGES